MEKDSQNSPIYAHLLSLKNNQGSPPPQAPMPETQNLNMPGAIIPLPEHEDVWKNMTLVYKNGVDVGLSDIVERTVLISGQKHLLFKSGRDIPLEIVNQNMEPNDEVFRYVPELDMMLNPPEPKHKTQKNNEEKKTSENSQKNINIEQKKVNNNNELNPIQQILKKKKKNIEKITVELNLDLPSQTLYIMLIDEFDAKPREIIDYCLNGDNFEELKNEISNTVLKNYYPEKFKRVEIQREAIKRRDNSEINTLEIEQEKKEEESNE